MASSTTRDKILDALERLLLEHSAQQSTLEAVAAEAGVSKGGLLYHFPTKEAMLAAMVRRMGKRSDDQFAEAVAGGTEVAEFYLQTFDEADFEDRPLYQSVLAALRSADGQHGEVHAAVVEIMRSWDHWLRDEFDDPVQAEIVRLVGDGIFMAALLDLPQPDPDLHRQVVDRLLGRDG